MDMSNFLGEIEVQFSSYEEIPLPEVVVRSQKVVDSSDDKLLVSLILPKKRKICKSKKIGK